MRGEKDRITGVSCYTVCHILSPWQGILVKVLEHAIDSDGQAGDDYRMLKTPQLGRLPQVSCGEEGDDQIAEKGVGALQSVI